MRRILVTGATGQIGSELVPELRKIHGSENVVLGVHSKPPLEEQKEAGPYERVDVSKRETIDAIVEDVHDYCAPMSPHDDCTMIALRYNGSE